MIKKKRVLIICWDNASYSQMAEGFSKDFNDNHYEIFSAGVEPQPLDPLAVQVMKESGINISQHLPKSVTTYADQSFDYIITLTEKAKEKCPMFPDVQQRIHWSIQDTEAIIDDVEKRLAAFRQARDEIQELIQLFSSLPELRTSPESVSQ